MKPMLLSPRHFFAGPKDVEETIAIRLGTAVDEWILSGKVRPHLIKPAELNGKPWQGNRKECKAWVKEQKEAGISVYTQEDYDRQMAMVRALESSSEFQALLAACPERQVPVFAKYREVDLKILIDMAGYDDNGNRILGDLKTSLSASPRLFAKKAATMDWDFQIATYSTVLGISEALESQPGLFWAVAESTKAAPVSIFSIPAEAYESGMRKLNRCIDLYKKCTESGEWPGYGKGFQTLPWPRWASGEADQEVQFEEETTNP